MRKYVLVDKDDIVIGTAFRDITDMSNPYDGIWLEAACWHYIPDDLEPEVGSVFINNPN